MVLFSFIARSCPFKCFEHTLWNEHSVSLTDYNLGIYGLIGINGLTLTLTLKKNAVDFQKLRYRTKIVRKQRSLRVWSFIIA